MSEFKYFKQLKIKQVCNRIETKSSKLLLFQLKSYCMVYFPRHHRLSIFLFFCVGNLFPGRNYCDVSHIFERAMLEKTSFHFMKGTLFRNLGQFFTMTITVTEGCHSFPQFILASSGPYLRCDHLQIFSIISSVNHCTLYSL